MKVPIARGFITLLVILSITQCKKNSTDADPSSPSFDPGLEQSAPPAIVSDSATIPYPTTAMLGCNSGPDYGGAVIYTQPATTNYIVHPKNTLAAGKFYAWPAGLSLDENTGAINLSKSVTGMRYVIGYIKGGTQDTCLSMLTISGASFRDSIYVVKGPAMATPYFDGNTLGGPVCGPGPMGKCAWDLSGNATTQHVHIDLKTGNIDLKASLDQKMFGDHPANGDSVSATIYYQLDDPSNNAIQSMILKFLYYEHVTDVPADIQSQIADRSSKINSNSIISLTKSPRPPLIVVVRAN